MDRPGYLEVAPARLPPPLHRLVECGWRAELPAGSPSHEQRVLPDGCMDLLLLDGRMVVAGPDTVAHLARSDAGSLTVGLRFRPGILPTLLGVPADAVRDRRVDLADVRSVPRPGGARPVGGGPSGPEPSAGDRAGAGLATLLETTTALLSAAERDRRAMPDPLPPAALRALAAGVRAAEVAARMGVTPRTLHRRCLATLGYGPAVARRVLRFRAAAGLLHAGVAPAAAAARAGYADQPHLSREVRALAGVSPAGLVAPG